MSKKTQPAPFIFGNRPEFIESEVKFPLPDGTEAVLKVKFAYRTRKEFGALWDEVAASSQDMAKPVEGEEPTYANLMGRGNAVNAKNAMKYIKAWEGVDVELSQASLEQLFDEAPAAYPALWDAYRNTALTGRTGN